MKKLIIFTILVMLLERVSAGEIICISNNVSYPQQTIANVWVLLPFDERGNSIAGNQILGQFDRVTNNTKFRFAFTAEEIKGFVQSFGESYLRIDGQNYFLLFEAGKNYMVKVDQNGEYVKVGFDELIPETNITIVTKKIHQDS